MPQLRVPALLAAASAALVLSSCSRDVPAAPLATFGMGDKVEIGHLVYRVFETQWLMQMAQDPPRIPQHRFLLVRLSVTNGAGGEVLLPGVTLEADNGNTYSELNSGEGVPQWIGILPKVKPGDSLQGNLLFDAPQQHYKLHVQDENSDSSALIDLPLNLSTEAPPQIAIPEGRKQ